MPAPPRPPGRSPPTSPTCPTRAPSPTRSPTPSSSGGRPRRRGQHRRDPAGRPLAPSHSPRAVGPGDPGEPHLHVPRVPGRAPPPARRPAARSSTRRRPRPSSATRGWRPTPRRRAACRLTHTLAVEYSKRGVRVNAIAPGSVRTGMTKGLDFPDDADFDLIPPHHVAHRLRATRGGGLGRRDAGLRRRRATSAARSSASTAAPTPERRDGSTCASPSAPRSSPRPSCAPIARAADEARLPRAWPWPTTCSTSRR